ncbi:unnamed protein product [Caenorhabditis brenneri]
MAKTVAEYYVTNYTRCKIDDSFLGSWQGLAYTSHFTQVFAVPVQVLTFSLIIHKTPSIMRCMKWPLLFSHFCFGTLSTPYLFYPQGALFGCGLLNTFNIPILILMFPGCFVICSMAISLVYLFESRSSAIHNNRWKIKKRSTRVIYYVTNYLLYTPVIYLLLNTPTDQEAAKLDSLKVTPCPTREFFTQPIYILFSDSFWGEFVVFVVFSTYIGINAVQIGFFILCSLFYLFIAPSYTISTHTRSYQIHFFIGIIIQTSVPLIVIVLTYAVAITAIMMDGMTQGIVNMCIVTVGIHGFAESLTIVLIHRPYRNFVWSLLTRKKDLKSL